MLTREQARSFYDRFGSKQDRQRLYEQPAFQALFAHAAFEKANAVVEVGCGTGQFAEQLMAHYLSESAIYIGFDLSPAMVTLARGRLEKYGDRAEVRLTDGSPKLPLPDAQFDRFVSNYVLDLLPSQDIGALLHEAHRVLVPGGHLCLVSLTRGVTPLSRILVWFWRQLHAIRPSLVGGCRPLELLDFISEEAWHMIHREVVVALGIPSEVVVACRPEGAQSFSRGLQPSSLCTTSWNDDSRSLPRSGYV